MTLAQSLVSLVIVGMDAAWGGGDGLDAFEHAVYECISGVSASAVAAEAPSASTTKVARPYGANSLQNSTVPMITAMLEKVTVRALADAGIFVGTHSDLRIALVTSVSDPHDLSWGWLHKVEDVSHRTNPLVAALEFARRTLGQDEADVVVFAAANCLPSSVNEEVESLRKKWCIRHAAI